MGSACCLAREPYTVIHDAASQTDERIEFLKLAPPPGPIAKSPPAGHPPPTEYGGLFVRAAAPPLPAPGEPSSCDPLCGTMDDRLAMVLELGTLDDDLHELKERHGRGIVEVDDIDAALSKVRCKIKELRIVIAHARNALLDTDASIRFHRWDTERALGMGR